MIAEVVAVGPLPPPIHGVSAINEILLSGFPGLRFVNTVKRKSSIRGMGNVTWGNIINAVCLFLEYFYATRTWKFSVLYLCLSQNRIGLARDIILLLLTPSEIKVVLHVHGGHFEQTWARLPKFIQKLVRLSMNNVVGVIVLNKKFSSVFRQIVPQRAIISPLPNGVVPIEGQGDRRETRHYSESSPMVLLYVGGLMKEKGVLDSIAAVNLARKMGFFVTLVLAGEWNDDVLRRTAEAMEGYGLVTNVGIVSGVHKARLFRESDAFVMPTYYPLEGQPLSLLEAMSAGLPIITTKHAAIFETVGEEGAIYVPPRDVRSMTAAILTLYRSATARERLAHANRKTFLAGNHSAESFCQRWLDVMSCACL